jgi:hypothetical protein
VNMKGRQHNSVHLGDRGPVRSIFRAKLNQECERAPDVAAMGKPVLVAIQFCPLFILA